MNWDFRKRGTRICVCYDVDNDSALKVWEDSDQPSVAELNREFRCGNNCAMCIPYFQDLLAEYRAGEWPAP